jgi:hypothetical protein
MIWPSSLPCPGISNLTTLVLPIFHPRLGSRQTNTLVPYLRSEMFSVLKKITGRNLKPNLKKRMAMIRRPDRPKLDTLKPAKVRASHLCHLSLSYQCQSQSITMNDHDAPESLALPCSEKVVQRELCSLPTDALICILAFLDPEEILSFRLVRPFSHRSVHCWIEHPTVVLPTISTRYQRTFCMAQRSSSHLLAENHLPQHLSSGGNVTLPAGTRSYISESFR